MSADDLKPWYSLRDLAELMCEPLHVVRKRAQRGTIPTVLHQRRRVALLNELRAWQPSLWESIVLALQLRPKGGKAIRPYFTASQYAMLADVSLCAARKKITRKKRTTIKIGGQHYITLAAIRDEEPEVWDSLVSALETRSLRGETD